MRADRLLSILMLLQVRGKMTAQALAVELEVSERTIYRDAEALCAAGVPLYTERGPGGGLALLDSYRTNLTGLTEDELRALFLLSVPAPLARLGISSELRSALLKLSAALPESRRAEETAARQRFHLDWNGWFQEEEPVPHLSVIQQAVWNDQQLLLAYPMVMEAYVRDARVNAYGLVAKAGEWFLVGECQGAMRVYRIARLANVEPTGERFARRADFDLAAFWQDWSARYEQGRYTYPVRLRLSPEILQYAPQYFGHSILRRITHEGTPGPDGWITLTVPFESLLEARGRLLSMGGAVEVLEPAALRLGMKDFAEQALLRYQGR
jgi:predicted DNA-binding transcriptional regulator YafY